MGFKKVFYVREAVTLCEAADGVLLGVARGEWGGVVRGDRGVDLQCFVRVVYIFEL